MIMRGVVASCKFSKANKNFGAKMERFFQTNQTNLYDKHLSLLVCYNKFIHFYTITTFAHQQTNKQVTMLPCKLESHKNLLFLNL